MVYPALKQVATALALVGALGSASAAKYDLGTLDSTLVYSNIKVEGAFDDTFTFLTGSQPTSATGTFAGIDIFGDMTFKYRFGTGTSPSGAFESEVKVVSDEDGIFSYQRPLNGLSANTQYWFNLTGSATQGAYSVTLAPVPEPESYALLLAGLGVVGVIVRRRKNSKTKIGA